MKCAGHACSEWSPGLADLTQGASAAQPQRRLPGSGGHRRQWSPTICGMPSCPCRGTGRCKPLLPCSEQVPLPESEIICPNAVLPLQGHICTLKVFLGLFTGDVHTSLMCRAASGVAAAQRMSGTGTSACPCRCMLFGSDCDGLSIVQVRFAASRIGPQHQAHPVARSGACSVLQLTCQHWQACSTGG